MKKKVWITILEKNETLGKDIFQELSRYGLQPAGHFREDDPSGLAWAALLPELTREDCAAWILAGEARHFEDPALRRELSLLALCAQDAHGHGFPILLFPSGGRLTGTGLSTPLSGAEILTGGLGAKTLARANAKRIHPEPEYRLRPHPLPGLGLWFELGPGKDPWEGAFFGCAGSDGPAPDAHGTGVAGTLPRTAILHHPVQGMTLTLGEREFTAWGVHNPLSPAESYYVRVSGSPDALVFGPFPEEDTAEVLTLSLV